MTRREGRGGSDDTSPRPNGAMGIGLCSIARRLRRGSQTPNTRAMAITKTGVAMT
ncbi:MAG: hypothetical protein U0164_20905 [Gemmatimonadaceae bacterium]